MSFLLNCLRLMFEISVPPGICVLISSFLAIFSREWGKIYWNWQYSSILHAVRNSNKISITKNIFKGDAERTLTVDKFTSFKQNTTHVWKNYGYFKQQPCDFSIEKGNLPENTTIHINQVYQSYKDNKKSIQCRLFLIGTG